MNVYRIELDGTALFELVAGNEEHLRNLLASRLATLSQHGSSISPTMCNVTKLGEVTDNHTKDPEVPPAQSAVKISAD